MPIIYTGNIVRCYIVGRKIKFYEYFLSWNGKEKGEEKLYDYSIRWKGKEDYLTPAKSFSAQINAHTKFSLAV